MATVTEEEKKIKIKDIKPEYTTMPGGGKSEPMTWKQMKIAIAKIRPVKLSGMDKLPEGTDLETFIKKFVLSWRAEHSTVDVENGTQQCRAGAARTLGDMTKLAQYYFPETGVAQIRRILKKLIEEDLVTFWVCGTINKMVFAGGKGKTNLANSSYRSMRDEFGLTILEDIKIEKKKSDATKETAEPGKSKPARKKIAKVVPRGTRKSTRQSDH